VVARNVQNLLSSVDPNTLSMPGKSYGNLIHKGAPLDRMLGNSNTNISSAAGDIREVLRDALQSSLSPQEAAAYQQARSQWKNMKTVEPLVMRADVVGGATPSTGDIIPSQLLGAVNRSFGNAARADLGDIPLKDLAQVGQRFMKELPTSQTAERGHMLHWLGAAGAALGGEQALSHMEPLHAAGAAAGTMALGRGLGTVLGSERLANRMIGAGPAPQGMERGVPLLTSAGVRQLQPPQEPSRNPQTGLPEYNLKANQQKASLDKLLDGSLDSHGATQDWIAQNKRDLRQQYGGQGLQNIALVSSLMRKAQDPKQQTVFSVLVNGTPPQAIQDAFRDAGVKTPADFMSFVVSNPALAKEMTAKVGENGRIPRVQRLTQAIRAAGGNNSNGSGAGGNSGEPNGAPSGGNLAAGGVAPQAQAAPQEAVPAHIAAAALGRQGAALPK
jgi:hypothetical protein